MQFDMPGAGQRRLRRSLDPIDRRVVEDERDALRNRRQSDHAAAGRAPVRDHRGMAAAIGNRGRRGEFRDQQLRVVDLRHHQDFAELCRDRRLARRLACGLRNQRHAGAVAADFKAERIAGHRAAGAIIDPAGLGFPRAPGVGGDIDLGSGIEPERAPGRGGNQQQDGHEEKAPKRAAARRQGHIGHGATFDQ